MSAFIKEVIVGRLGSEYEVDKNGTTWVTMRGSLRGVSEGRQLEDNERVECYVEMRGVETGEEGRNES